MRTNTDHSAHSRAQITLANVSVSHGGSPVLHGVDLAVSPQSRIGIVGENGRGKSTLLQLLAGALPPDSGAVIRVGSIGVAEQEMPADDDRTVDDAVAEAIADSLSALAELDTAGLALAADAAATGDTEDVRVAERYAAALERAEALGAWDAERRVSLALAELDADFPRELPLRELSVGQRYRVRLACLLGGDHDLLLLDEPTNHLDRSSLDFLASSLRDRHGGVAIVSHDRALLADIADTIVDLDPTVDDRPRVYGGYESYREGREAELARWEQQHEREQQERRRLEDDLSAAQNRLSTGWRPEKGTAKHQRQSRAPGIAQAMHRRREALEAHAVTMPEPPLRFRFPELRTRAGAALISVDGAAVEGRLAEVGAFEVRGGSRLVITGPNGAGKSTLLRLLAGELQPDEGRVERTHSARIVLLAQESQLPQRAIAAQVFEERTARVGSRADGAPSLASLGLLRARDTGKRIGELSIGQQRRLDLAIALAQKPHALLLDEPTNHLSIALVDELTEALRSTPAAVVVTSHDRQLLRDLSDWPRLELASREG